MACLLDTTVFDTCFRVFEKNWITGTVTASSSFERINRLQVACES